MTAFASFVVKNLHEFKADLEKADKARIKASQDAVKLEGFELMTKLKREIEAGAPGGRPFSPLTEIAKRTGRGRNRKPLAKLAKPVRYRISKGANNFLMSIGYLTEDIANPDIKSKNRISKSWARIVSFQQAGGQIPVKEELRRVLIGIGAKLKKRRVAEAKYFFLLPSTAQLKVPPRPIIDPFWNAHKAEIMPKIQKYFDRKLKGEYVESYK